MIDDFDRWRPIVLEEIEMSLRHWKNDAILYKIMAWTSSLKLSQAGKNKLKYSIDRVYDIDMVSSFEFETRKVYESMRRLVNEWRKQSKPLPGEKDHWVYQWHYKTPTWRVVGSADCLLRWRDQACEFDPEFEMTINMGEFLGLSPLIKSDIPPRIVVTHRGTMCWQEGTLDLVDEDDLR